MASKKLFVAVRRFPDDVPTVSTYTVSLAKLNSAHLAAAKSVLDVCEKFGLFLLDQQSDSLGEPLISEIDNLFEARRDIMNLPNEVKDKS
jgi:hypothetical protein